MRRLILPLSVLVVCLLAVATARAGYPYGGYYGPSYAPNYGYQVNNYYGGRSFGGYYSGHDSHSEAVRRIMAAHSRYRYYTHPRSMYNSPPTQADYFGWDWGY